MHRVGYDSRLVVGRSLSRSLLGILCVRGIRVLGRWKFKEVGGVCIIVYVGSLQFILCNPEVGRNVDVDVDMDMRIFAFLWMYGWVRE